MYNSFDFWGESQHLFLENGDHFCKEYMDALVCLVCCAHASVVIPSFTFAYWVNNDVNYTHNVLLLSLHNAILSSSEYHNE